MRPLLQSRLAYCFRIPLALTIAILTLPISALAQTWTYMGLGGEIVYAVQAHGSSLYAGTEHGFWTRPRAGADTTWTRLSLATYEVTDFVFADDSTVVAGRYDEDADDSDLIRSTNGGVSWSMVAGPGLFYISDLEMRGDRPDTIYACTWYGQILKSTNRGASWTQLMGFTGAPWYRLAISAQNASHLLAGGSGLFYNAKLFESLNGGTTWTPVSSLGSPGGDNGVLGIAFDPSNESRIHVGLQDYTARSTNGGASWSTLNYTSSGSWNANDVAVDPSQPSHVFYLAEDIYGGTRPLRLVMSTDAGASWNIISHDPGYGFGEARDLETAVESGTTVVYLGGRGIYRIGPFAISGAPGIAPPVSASLEPAYRVNGSLVIPYRVTEPGTTVTLTIFDVLGRPIHEFPAVVRDAGRFEVTWSGVDDGGSRAVAGVYFARLGLPGNSVSEKIYWAGE